MAQRGWHKITRGWYQYTNAAGKVLAFAERTGSTWAVEILPMADAARAVNLSARPGTLADAKVVAENAYKHLTQVCLKEEAANRARLARI